MARLAPGIVFFKAVFAYQFSAAAISNSTPGKTG